MRRSFKQTIFLLKKNGKDVVSAIVATLVLCTSVLLVAYFLPKPNDNIYASNTLYLFENENPQFNVGFGSQKSSQQYVRFESKVSQDNPFEEGDKNIWGKVKELFSTKKGFEMSLSEVGLSYGDGEVIPEVVKTFGEESGTSSITTNTEVIEVARVIGEEDIEGVSKQTVINRDVYPGIDIEYQIIEGYGVKEDIVINDIDEYFSSCDVDGECSIPLNEFVFDLILDEGVVVRKTNTLYNSDEEPIYYLSTEKGEYIAHFLPTTVVDEAGTKTNAVNMEVEHVEGQSYKIYITLDPVWLFSGNRVFPIRIDPSVVHDTELELSTGTLDRVNVTERANLEILEGYISGIYTSEIIDLQSQSTLENIEYISSGKSTGNGEIPYSTMNLIVELNLNRNGINAGSCGSDCDLSLKNTFGNEYSGWTSQNRKWGTGALFCDGIDDYGYIQNYQWFNSLESFSFEMWYRSAQELSGDQTIAGSERFGFGVYDGEFGFWVNKSEHMAKTGLPKLGEWSYWVGVYNGNNIVLYKDGVEVNRIEYSDDLLNSNTQFRLCSGTQDGSNYTYSRGVIDTVRVYDRALRESEIVSNYSMIDIKLDYRTSLDNMTWSNWNRREESLEVDLSDITDAYIENIENEYSLRQKYIQEIELLDLSDVDIVAVDIASDVLDENIEFSYGRSLYSLNESDSSTLGLWSFEDYNSEEIVTLDSITDKILWEDLDEWSIDLLFETGEELSDEEILNIGSSTLSIVDSTLELYLRGVENVLSELKTEKTYYITIIWGEQIAKLYINGVYIKDLETGEEAPVGSGLNVNPGITTIKSLRVSDIARAEEDIRQVYEYLTGSRSYSIKMSFKANLSSVDTVENPEDLKLLIDERPYGAVDSVERLLVGDKIVIKEEIENIEYIAQGIVESIDTQTGNTKVREWEEGSKVPVGGFTENATVFRWQTEYLQLRNILPEDRSEIMYISVKKLADLDATLFLDNLRSVQYEDTLEFEEVENIQYLQYQVVLLRNDINISPYLVEIELIYEEPGPLMDQLMRHGKWFSNSGEEQSFWWVDN